MIDIEQFKANAQSHGICAMLDEWNNCKSKKQLIDLCLSIRGMQYVANAIAQGWGCDADYIEHEFAPFNNGKYIREKDGYTSAMYCRPPEDKIEITTTAALIIDFEGVVKVDRPCELYIVNSRIEFVGNGHANVYLYNSEVGNRTLLPTVGIMEDEKY